MLWFRNFFIIFLQNIGFFVQTNAIF
jgi:hypothetical protein